MLNDCVNDGSLPVHERCEGSVSYDERDDKILIESKSCINIGVDWDNDEWEDNDDINFPPDRLRL